MYFLENGDSLVPLKYEYPDGFRLGAWAAAQRVRRKAGFLTDEQVAELDEYRFVWDCRETWWETGYEHLKEFYRENHHAQVPKKYRSPDGFNLGIWMRRQRKRLGRAVGNQKPLTEYQIEKLNQVGMDWGEAGNHKTTKKGGDAR